MSRHLTYDRLGEGSGDRRRTDEHCWLCFPHNIVQCKESEDATLHDATRFIWLCELPLGGAEISPAIMYQPVAVHQPDCVACVLRRGALLNHRRDHLFADACGGGACAEHDDALLPKRCNRSELTAESRPASVTAPVPWMSSLKERTVSR